MKQYLIAALAAGALAGCLGQETPLATDAPGAAPPRAHEAPAPAEAPDAAPPEAPAAEIATTKTPQAPDKAKALPPPAEKRTAFEASIPPPPGAPAATCWAELTPGEQAETPCAYELTGEFISSVQRALSARQVYDGPITGKFDGKTREALRQWQAAEGTDTTVLLISTARSFGLIPYPMGKEPSPAATGLPLVIPAADPDAPAPVNPEAPADPKDPAGTGSETPAKPAPAG